MSRMYLIKLLKTEHEKPLTELVGRQLNAVTSKQKSVKE